MDRTAGTPPAGHSDARAESGVGVPIPTIVVTIRQALEEAGPRPETGAGRSDKKNYAERLSRNIATCFANLLRKDFDGILPSESGKQQESHARTSRGLKKLDVNYSTVELGLALGVSIKTLNYRDASTKRYTKNYSRNDNELRAEATDYHQRQPYAVLVAVLFLPIDSCDDADKGNKKETGISSFAAAVRYFRHRANRKTPRDDIDLFERFFIGLYEPSGDNLGDTMFFDVMTPPPRNRRPKVTESFDLLEVAEEIRETYDARNQPRVDWAED